MNQVKENKKAAQKLWATNKYFVLSKSQRIYQDIRNYLKTDPVDPQVVQDYIDQAQALAEDPGAVVNATQHVWGYFKDQANASERNSYQDILSHYQSGQIDQGTVIKFLNDMLAQYPNDYLSQQTWLDQAD
ncbi:hypothetical protein AWM75_08465 [Aerococcus urinaehominis]|uniref:Uncharacterized protein n=1 Tax=Aerococcus urinaehominis TaxID=128944 RepID=A0A0X8FMK3_9LACT|nr:YbgA family protein [Aerococcus urinaehominis]AMC00003.1 hypothetical protein AWM75_08465 [Aerococcus urinaehominis]SDL82329.1 Protein of unknown function [Aerococcus urinaehominis]